MPDEIQETPAVAETVPEEATFPEPIWAELTDSQKLDVISHKLDSIDDVIARIDWVAGALEKVVIPTLARVNDLLDMAEKMAGSPMGATMVKRMTGKGV
jgi:hypothetical protein